MKRKVNRKSVKKNAPMNNDNFRGIDLWEDYENIPPRINAIIERYQDLYGEDLSGMDYKDTARMLEEFEKQGYTFDYYLDNQPYGLRPIGVKLNELKGYEEFGDDEYGGGGETPMANYGKKLEEHKGGIRHYSIDIDLENGDAIRDLTTTSFDDAERMFTQYASQMEYDGEKIDNVQLVAVFNNNDYEVIDSQFSNGGKTRMAKKGMKTETIGASGSKYKVELWKSFEDMREGERPYKIVYSLNEQEIRDLAEQNDGASKLYQKRKGKYNNFSTYLENGGQCMYGLGGEVTDIDMEIATNDLKEELREKMKDGDDVIHFAYTDYGGDFLDKVAIEYFEENYPNNIVSEDTSYSGKNAFVFGKPATEWLEASQNYLLGFDDIENYYYERQTEEEYKGFNDFLNDLRMSYVFNKKKVLDWLMENRGGYYGVTTQGLDYSTDDLIEVLENEGLIKKSKEYGGGGKTKKDKDAQYWLNVIYNDEVYGLIENFLDVYEKSYAAYLIDADLSTDTNDIKNYAEVVKKSFIQLMKVDGDLRKLNDKLYGILDSLAGYVGESQKTIENRIKRTIPKLEDVYIQIVDKLQFAEDSIYYGLKGKIFNDEFEGVEDFKEYVSEIIEVVKIKIHYINNYQDIMGMARNGMEVKNWSASDVSNAEYLGIIEFEDSEGEFHNFEVMETEDRLVFGGITNSGFIESGYIEKDGRSTRETLENLMEDLEIYYVDGEEYTSEIVVNQRMGNGGTFGGGGSIEDGNYHMILSQAKQVQHHVSELQDILKKEDDIEAWVVAKMQDVSSTLSDVTHYLDGKSEMPMAKRGMKVGSKGNEITLTQSEKNQYKNIISAIEKADDSRIKMGEECYDEKEMIEDKIYGLQKEQEEFKYKLLQKYGNTPQIKKAIDSQLYYSLYESMVKGRKTKKAKNGMKVGEIKYPTITLKEYDLNDDQTEIYAYIETRQELQSQYDTIRKNLMTKIARGEFDESKAPKLFMYLVENGLKLYSKNFGEIKLSKQEKEEIANNMVVDFMSEAELRNYENETFLPKKYLAENGMMVMTFDIYDENGDCVGNGMVAQDVVDYANLLWYYDMMDEDGEGIDDFDVAKDYLEQDGFNIESHNPEKSSSATKKRKIIRNSKK